MKRRLFVSISLPDWLVDELSSYGEDIKLKEFSWTKEDNLHITVHFIGYIEDDDVDGISIKLSEAVRGLKSFSLALDSIKFGPPGDVSRMIWAMFKESPEYNALARCVADALGELSERSTKRPIPHVTLARFKVTSLAKGIELKQLKKTEFEVSKIELMESKLSDYGAEYSAIEEYSLE